MLYKINFRGGKANNYSPLISITLVIRLMEYVVVAMVTTCMTDHEATPRKDNFVWRIYCDQQRSCYGNALNVNPGFSENQDKS